MSVASESKNTVPGYQTGVWDIDPVHSEVSFVVRHMVVSKVRGRFGKVEGSIVLADEPLQSSVEARIDAASVDTNNEQRDAHVRSGDFLDTDNHPNIAFVSTGLRSERDRFLLDGELTIRGTTRSVTLTVEANGFTPDPYGGTRAGFSAHTDIDRTDFGVSYNGPIPGADNAMVLSDKISIDLEIEAVLRPDAA